MDQVKMEFILENQDKLGSLTEETAHYIEDEEGGDFRKDGDIPVKISEKIDIVDEEGEYLRLNSGIFEALLADTRRPEKTTDCVRTKSDILECMTVTSSPGEQITNDLLEELNEDLENNGIFTAEENDFGNVHVMRNPTPIIVGADHKFAVCSRYLKAPLASRHDLCKSGHNYLLKDPKKCILGTIGEARPLMRATSNTICLSKVETKKKTLLRRSSLPSIIVKNDSEMHVKSMNHPKKDFKCLNLKRVQGEVKPPWVPTSGYSSSRTKTDIQAGKKMAVCSPKLVENPSQTFKEINTRKESGSHSRVTKERAKEPINNPVTSKMNTRIHKNLQSFDRSKNQSNSKKGDKIKGSFDVPEKTLFMIRPSTGKNPTKGAFKVASSRKSLWNTEKAKEPISNSLSPWTPRILKRSPIVKPRLHKNMKSSYWLKNQNNPEETKITGSFYSPEKTLYMIEPNTDKKPSRRASMLASSNKSLYMVEPNSDKKRSRRASLSVSSNKRLLNTPRASHGSKDKGPEYKQKVIEIDRLSPLSTPTSISTVSIAQEPCEPLRENQQDLYSMETREIGTTTEDEDSSLVVKFRRGTVVSLLVEDTSPERLQFRKRRVVGDDQNAKDEAEAPCLKKTKSTDEPQDTEHETSKVLLRHQEAVDKKDNVDLNNVIGETASKLVKSSKSKVKALVSAFETVISLRDYKHLLATRVV